ncbi:hypothetical protein BATDEDRAFT_89893 [Batrachochytrium dendrobatidis JAM81]|uniref:Uncharacterized protein n=1 Tax=Batrachochytrium dendrobatidis (strain JAM81 / FGSC 10211) TaxID=684364 RepID=F4P5Q5_BATDJ|nr:uncharacterized protein BATDEDRAFT_89893 [Batrachochytrium dendrobatidis JAM81]EGF79227.1 hypothetical protein BATDEDRAFT_89893 [Batrachochytrium dendrobatidis JAM81]|eukprot:XP_006680064.1 hypothetical protein BATDEDRAFT_89893 [Batrachochytrium dendrobatidis JAM81]
MTASKSRILNRNNLTDSGGSSSFGRTYFSLCHLHFLPVRTEVMRPALESNNQLYLDVDRIKRDREWTPLLQAIHQNRDLMQLSVFSNHKTAIKNNDSKVHSVKINVSQGAHMAKTAHQNPIAQSEATVSRVLIPLISAVRECLTHNHHLTKLEIVGFHLRETAVTLLAKGLYNNKVLQELSLARTDLGDSGIYSLALSIRTIIHLKHLNLSACMLTEKGAHNIAALLKSLAVKRQAEKWAGSLRLSGEDSERVESGNNLPLKAPVSLKRLNLCHNRIGDIGCEALLDLVREEVGLLALDMQFNELTTKSAVLAHTVLEQNIEMTVFDIRNNLIEDKYLYSIHKLLFRNDQQRCEITKTGRKSALSRESSVSNAMTIQPDPDLYWLDSKDPLKDTYYLIDASIRHHLHTESSITKRKILSNQKVSQTRVIGQKLPSVFHNLQKETPCLNSVKKTCTPTTNKKKEMPKNSSQGIHHTLAEMNAMAALESYISHRISPQSNTPSHLKSIAGVQSSIKPDSLKSCLKTPIECWVSTNPEPPSILTTESEPVINTAKSTVSKVNPISSQPMRGLHPNDIARIASTIGDTDMEIHKEDIPVTYALDQVLVSNNNVDIVNAVKPSHPLDQPLDVKIAIECKPTQASNTTTNVLDSKKMDLLQTRLDQIDTDSSISKSTKYQNASKPFPFVTTGSAEFGELIQLSGTSCSQNPSQSLVSIQQQLHRVSQHLSDPTAYTSNLQMNMLIKLVESSLESFHTMLDQIDEREKCKRQRRQEKKAHSVQHRGHSNTISCNHTNADMSGDGLSE